MKELGTITINVLKDEANQYLFDIPKDNKDLSCIIDVLEDTLKNTKD